MWVSCPICVERIYLYKPHVYFSDTQIYHVACFLRFKGVKLTSGVSASELTQSVSASELVFAFEPSTFWMNVGCPMRGLA